MSKFINPFTDVGFKKIFGQSVTKGLLIDFLNDLLKGEKQIKAHHVSGQGTDAHLRWRSRIDIRYLLHHRDR